MLAKRREGFDMSETSTDKNLSKGLFILRISIVLFLVPWVLEKFTKPEQTAKIFSHFYHVDDLPVAGSYAVGVAWVLLLLAFAFGIKKRISYGLVTLFHGLATIFSIHYMLPFLESYNHLFLAALPTLAGMILLYMMRDRDTIGTVGR